METTESVEGLKAELNLLTKRVEALEAKASGYRAPAPIGAKVSQPSTPKTEGKGAGAVLGWMGALCFLFAAGILIKLGVQSGWFTPVRQVTVAWLFGLTLIGTGVVFKKRDESYFALLPGAGVAILFLAVCGGGVVHQLYDESTTLALSVVVSIVCLLLVRVLESDVYGFFAVLGSYLVPHMLPELRRSAPMMMVVFGLWDVVFSGVAIALGRRAIIPFAAYFSITGFLSYTTFQSNLIGAAFQAGQMALFAVASGCYTTKHKTSLTAPEAWLYFPLLVFFYLTEYALISKTNPELAPWISLGFAGFIYWVYSKTKSSLGGPQLASRGMVHASCIFMVLHSVYLELLPPQLQPFFGLALIFFLPKVNGLSAVFVFLAIAFSYGKSVVWNLGTSHSGEGLILAAGFSVALISIYLRHRGKWVSSDQKLGGALVLAFAHLQALFGFYNLAPRLADLTGASIQKFVLSGLWGAFAILILLIAKRLKDGNLAKSSLLVFFVASVKVFLFDVSGAEPIVRLFCFLVMGACLFGGGYLFRRIGDWRGS